MVFQKQEVNDDDIIFQTDALIFPNMKIYVPWILRQSKFSYDSNALFLSGVMQRSAVSTTSYIRPFQNEKWHWVRICFFKGFIYSFSRLKQIFIFDDDD